MKNKQIADIFSGIADILEIKGENIFKINAYRKASRVLTDMQNDVEVVWQKKQLTELPGIGEALVKKIDEFLTSGKVKKYEELKSEISAGLVQLLNIQNLGPKTIALAHKQLQVNNFGDLNRVIEDGSLAKLPGMGEKKVDNIRNSLTYFMSTQDCILLGEAAPIAEEIILYLKEKTQIDLISAAGSVRRMKETVHDIDILTATPAAKEISDIFINMPKVAEVLARGETKVAVRLETGLQVDLRLVLAESFGAALQYFTGSQAHNIKLRGLAKKQGLKINEYGVFKGDRQIGGRTEQQMYSALNLRWIPPEMREDRGEVELAASSDLPELIELKDIRGDLHVHSNYSDGHFSVENMAEKARQLNYNYLAICDHSQSAAYANGLSAEKLLEQIKHIDVLNKRFHDFKILKGIEVDILADGSLDFPDSILAQLDIVVASIHSGFKQNPTERILKALDNPLVDIIGHPTGRLINRREGYEVDLTKVFEKAKSKGVALEINAYPWRLDLSDLNAKLADKAGALLAINTDSHSTEDLNFMNFGIGTARRGWLTKKSVINHFSMKQLLNWTQKRKSNREGI